MELQLGAENVTDEEPPILYQNNVINANTDVQTYDTVGRFYWGRFTYKF
jgi:outer membrane receptor protein involved in Fe transport